jgi:hypothetical protein
MTTLNDRRYDLEKVVFKNDPKRRKFSPAR